STSTTLEERRSFAGKAFQVSSHYDGAIQRYFAGQSLHRNEMKLGKPFQQSFYALLKSSK
ncbi:MAG: hypothetical protein ACKOUQ_01935, partial [Aquirufa sp.]